MARTVGIALAVALLAAGCGVRTTKPFTAKVYYRLSTDTQLIEFVCIDKDAQHYVGGAGNK